LTNEINMVYSKLQTSDKIKEHLQELNDSFDVSKDKELLNETIAEWNEVLHIKLEEEKEY